MHTAVLIQTSSAILQKRYINGVGKELESESTTKRSILYLNAFYLGITYTDDSKGMISTSIQVRYGVINSGQVELATRAVDPFDLASRINACDLALVVLPHEVLHLH